MGTPTYVATQSLCVTFTHCDFGLSLCFPFAIPNKRSTLVALFYTPLGIDVWGKDISYTS